MTNGLVSGNVNIGPLSVSKQKEDMIASLLISSALLDDPVLQAAQLISTVGIDGVDAFGYDKQIDRGSITEQGTIDYIMNNVYSTVTNKTKQIVQSKGGSPEQVAALSTGFIETYPPMFSNDCFAGHFGMIPINQGPPLSLCPGDSDTIPSPNSQCCPNSAYYYGYYDYFRKNYELYKTNNITTPDYFNSNLLQPGKAEANAQKARYIILLGLIIVIVLAMIFTVMVAI